MKPIFVWDLPTRLFHWLLALVVAGAVLTGQIGGNWIECHGLLGLAAIGLIAFRLVWGLVGSTYARFSQFFPSPARISAYLKGNWKGLGHNPLGALSVFALLGIVTLQAVSGLFSNDDIAFNGPLHALVAPALSNRLTGLHRLASNLLYLIVVLHIAAIVFYLRVKKDNLVKPMLTGWKAVPEGESATGGGLVAFILALAIGLGAVYTASGAWIAEAPPPPKTETPAW